MQHFDVVILGAGFGGSLTALLLDRIGLSVALINRGRHPRFSIGESSTPIAGYLLKSLSEEYDLPQFQPFCKYGTWQESYPHLACGIKRGFSYFSHEPDQKFQTKLEHGSELLVTANHSDLLADTHWYRADVDHFFAEEVQKSNVVYLDQTEVDLKLSGEWSIRGERMGDRVDIRAAFLIDATGAAGMVPEALGIERKTDFQTNSRALYGHFKNVTSWREILNQNQIDQSDYPFDCDSAALHHVLREGWMWQLRFNNGIASAGFVLDSVQNEVSAEQIWGELLNRYPAIQSQFNGASVIAPESGLCITNRLQRGWKVCAGENWALLPHTAGFIDPLHSTGIAHTLCGIERLVERFKKYWGQDEFTEALAAYSESIQTELALIDELVSCCYRTLNHFDLFSVSTLFYFAAATSFEHLRCLEGERPLFLCADDAGFKQAIRDWLDLVSRFQLEGDYDSDEIKQVVFKAEQLLKPWNRVGLFHPRSSNMYHYTAAPE
ncbi:MAG: tryptophan 7-halogenase [Planctomycetes bacterium]|nr:tryptophan 7-halogenase [Planctomycetota bacterium]MCH9724840.1 tryptophan 7-halogenase [Planctomycetota bacterium]MCH9778780.1 tryptophan 7-halogenase [Planctomycetota bacterium]MCH9792077.1 tryptophan 7-halogenase [Planctomycetota bacterium]